MECNATVNPFVLIALLEMPIHVGINKAEYNRLIAHQCLIMTFGIRDGLFVLATVGHLPEHAGRLPVLIHLLLDNLNPIIRDVHCHPIVKAVTSVMERQCQSRHTGHLFGNRNRL